MASAIRSRHELIYCTGRVDPAQIRLFASLGVDLVSFPATCDFHLYHLAAPVWVGPDQYDYADLDKTVRAILDANPRCRLLPRVFSCSPPWWDALHPGALVTWEDGSRARPLLHGAAKDAVPSLASTDWCEAMERNVASFVRHMEEGPFAENVLGYFVTSLNSEEWFHWGTMEGYLFDYNEEAEERFRDWLRKRYGTDEELSRVWGRSVALRNASIPRPERLRSRPHLAFLASPSDEDIIDHRRFLADHIVDVISRLAARVKQLSGPDRWFGTFYGYLLELSFHPGGLQHGGHGALRRLLDDENVDFLASPTSYARRAIGRGFSMAMGPTASITRSGKAFFHENDVRTHLLWDDAGYGRTENAFETSSIQRREFAYALTQASGMWWFDMTGGWYDDPAVRETLGTLVGVARTAEVLPRASVAEIAIVVDPAANLAAEGPPYQMVRLMVSPCLELAQVGAPFDVLLLDDLDDLASYRVVVLPNFYCADEKRRQHVHAYLERRGATAVWLVAPGLASGLESTEALTGISCYLTPDAGWKEAETHEGEILGAYDWWGPRLAWNVTEQEVLARYAGTDHVAAARRTCDNWTSVVSGVPALTPSLWRTLAKDAGVHLYVETGDLVYACNRFVALHARASGIKRLSVPGAECLWDLVHQCEVPLEAGSFEAYVPEGETALWFRGSAGTWRRAEQAARHARGDLLAAPTSFEARPTGR